MDQDIQQVPRYQFTQYEDRRERTLLRWQGGCLVLFGIVVGLLVAEISPRAGAAIVPLPLGAAERAGLLQEYAKQITDRNALITNLQVQVKHLNATVRQKEQALAVAETQPAAMPDPELLEALHTEKGLIDETHRITGIEHVAIVELPTGTRWR